MDFDKTLRASMEKFLTLHPRESWPNWVCKCISFEGRKDDHGIWTIEFTGIKRQPLPADSHFEIINGREELVRINPETGEKGIIISWGSIPLSDIIVIFKTSVDPETLEVTVLIDSDFSSYGFDDDSLYRIGEI